MASLRIIPTKDSLEAVDIALANSNERRNVTGVQIHSTLERGDPGWEDDTAYRNEDLHDPQIFHAEKPTGFLPMLRKLGRFENLETVSLKYAIGCASDTSGDNDPYHWIEVEDDRHPVLAALFEGLNDSKHPARKVHTLSIKNLQNVAKHEIMTSENCKAVLSRLKSLHLQVTTEQLNHKYQWKNCEFPEVHRFYGEELKKYWLQPVQSQLENLQIYGAEDYWGYYPLCDLRDIHFPRLKSLMLGQMTFYHEWQMRWILKHRTLERLVLDSCPILHGCRFGAPFGYDREPPGLEQAIHNTAWDQSAWLYGMRWQDAFDRIRCGLPKLKYFGFGHGSWGEDEQRAFEEAEMLPAKIYPQRYVIFDKQTLPFPWIWPESARENQGSIAGTSMEERFEQYDCCWDEHPPYPDADVADASALQELKEEIARRNSGPQPYWHRR